MNLRWAQEDIGIALGLLTEGSIEKCNQDVKQTNTRFVKNIHINTLTRRSWAVDPLLHFEATVKQVDYLDINSNYHFIGIMQNRLSKEDTSRELAEAAGSRDGALSVVQHS